MITIEDSDTPIEVAKKIITGTRKYERTAVQKAIARAWLGESEPNDVGVADMFTTSEIGEIASYLFVYWKTHKDEEK